MMTGYASKGQWKEIAKRVVNKYSEDLKAALRSHTKVNGYQPTIIIRKGCRHLKAQVEGY